MAIERPLLVVLSSTRNYAWCTRAFLEVNTKWADYVIIVDQMSTDGTREMCAEYDNVILIDDHDMEYKEGTHCKMLIDRARQIPGDKILFDLAIDEVMPANIINTKDWQRILNSKPGDFFLTQWANLLSDKKSYKVDSEGHPWMYRILHDDGVTPYNLKQEMHTMTLPYPPNARIFEVNDFPILHFGNGYYDKWNYFKFRYYQMVDINQGLSKTLVHLLRAYSNWSVPDNVIRKPLEESWIEYGYDIFSLVDNTSDPIIVSYMLDLLQENGIQKYSGLDIWDDAVCKALGVSDPRSRGQRYLHRYIRATQKNAKSLTIRVIDKFLKCLIK